MSMSDTTFPQRLALVRRDRGYSQKSVAEKLNISQALLSHYEKGIREPGLDFVAKICRLYGVSADYMLGLSDQENESRESQVMKAVCTLLDQEELYPALQAQMYSLLRASADMPELFRLEDKVFSSGAVQAYANRHVARATLSATDMNERITALKTVLPHKYEGLLEMIRDVEERTMEFLK